MQREIKFRGIDIHTGQWDYGYYIERKDGHDKSHKIYDPKSGIWYKVKPETVGQFTESKDRGDAEIYDGSLVKHFRMKGVGKAWWNRTIGAFSIDWAINGENSEGSGRHWPTLQQSSQLECIGTIHTHPELLK